MACPIICVGCRLDIMRTLEVRRNLGEKYKGHEREARKRVLSLWKKNYCVGKAMNQFVKRTTYKCATLVLTAMIKLPRVYLYLVRNLKPH